MGKVWLNNLKKGDTFYYIINHEVQKLEIIGRVEDKYFLMPRFTVKVCDKEDVSLTIFVNKYVYTDEETAKNALIEELKDEVSDCEKKLIEHMAEIEFLEDKIRELKKLQEND